MVKSADVEPVFDALAERLGRRVERDRPLGPLTTYGVGGPAALFVEIDGPADVEAVQAALVGSTVPVWVIGRGSNLLVADAGFAGVVVRLGSGFNTIDLPAGAGAADGPDGPVAKVGASVPLPVLARQAAEAGWAGLTWAVGVPGSVGGAVRMNAGGHGSDMAASLKRYTWVDLVAGTGGTDGVSRLRYGYRRSSVGPSELVLAAELALIPWRGRDRKGRTGIHRALAPAPSTGRVQRRLGVHQPRGRLGRTPD